MTAYKMICSKNTILILQAIYNARDQIDLAEDDELNAFTEATTVDIINDFSNVSPVRVAGGYLLMVSYRTISLHCFFHFYPSVKRGIVIIMSVVVREIFSLAL